MWKTVFTAAVLAISCSSPSIDASAQAQSSSKSSRAPTSSADLDKVLAPIALYPDQLIAQILLCAADPAKVTELNKWLASNADLKGTAVQDAATVDGFEPSFVALALFPQVVGYMAKNLDWTTRLGKAFAADKSAVFSSIQRLRAQAQKSGALKDTPQQNVESMTTSSGEQVIIIEPANPQVIYVPQYDPQVVYVEDNDNSDAAIAGLIGFTAGIALGAAVDNDYYYGPYGWHGGVHMYNDAWDDWYDHREDAREDWVDHREDLVEERGERASDAREQRTERTGERQETRQSGQEQRTERQGNRQENRPQATQAQRDQARTQAQTRATQGTSGRTSTQQKGSYSRGSEAGRTGTKSDAFSGYSSGRSERAASARGQSSRGSSRGGGGRRR